MPLSAQLRVTSENSPRKWPRARNRGSNFTSSPSLPSGASVGGATSRMLMHFTTVLLSRVASQPPRPMMPNALIDPDGHELSFTRPLLPVSACPWAAPLNRVSLQHRHYWNFSKGSTHLQIWGGESTPLAQRRGRPTQ